MTIVVDSMEETMQVISIIQRCKIYTIHNLFIIYIGHTIVAGNKKYAFHLLPSG